MKNIALWIGLAGLVTACGASMQAPTDRLAATDAAIRSAQELGANQDPQAQLHLNLAAEQADQARKLIKNGENRRADLVLQRAKSDAELSVMLTKERAAEADASKARQNLQETGK